MILNSIIVYQPSFDHDGYRDTAWTKYIILLSGISGTSAGRIAFRYVTDAGSGGNNSNYIGIDEFFMKLFYPLHYLILREA